MSSLRLMGICKCLIYSETGDMFKCHSSFYDETGTFTWTEGSFMNILQSDLRLGAFANTTQSYLLKIAWCILTNLKSGVFVNASQPGLIWHWWHLWPLPCSLMRWRDIHDILNTQCWKLQWDIPLAKEGEWYATRKWLMLWHIGLMIIAVVVTNLLWHIGIDNNIH